MPNNLTLISLRPRNEIKGLFWVFLYKKKSLKML